MTGALIIFFVFVFLAIFIVSAIFILSYFTKHISIKGKWHIYRRKKSADEKGATGEALVARVLGNTIPGQQYVLHNLLFSDEEGNTCQIDHIYINPRGIWVIETKNYAGRIYGNDNQQEWMQVLAYGNTKNRFYNPVKQNATHIYRLSKYLKRKDFFQNIVCFLYDADIVDVQSSHVYTIATLPNIKNIITNVRMSIDEMEYYYQQLCALHINNHTTLEEHINNIHQKEYYLQQGICPRCGQPLVLRQGSYQSFYGCSGYPKCKFKKKI